MKILKDEKQIILDHEYDGIRELDNSLPPWWLWLFFITIGFSVVYTVGYEITRSFYLPEQELQAEKEYYNSLEVEIKQSTDEASLAKGKEIFGSTCATCHNINGGGGIGPNLTDSHWIYGKGKFEDIVKMVNDGSPPNSASTDKMPAHKNMGGRKVGYVSSYVMTLLNTNVEGGKKPEGTLVGEKKEKKSSEVSDKKEAKKTPVKKDK